MKTFPSYDYTLCNAKDCKKKENCVRYLTYQKAQAEKYPYMLSVNYPKKAKDDCRLFVDAEKY